MLGAKVTEVRVAPMQDPDTYALDRIELLDELRLRGVSGGLPRSVRVEGHGRHQLEIEARAANKAVHGGTLHRLELRQILIDDLTNRLKRHRVSLVPGVLAAPLAADTVERHRAIREGHRVELGRSPR